MDNIICQGTIPKIADHEGVIVCFDTKNEKAKTKSRVIYDYKNVDEVGLINHIKNFDFENVVFSKSITNQAEIFTSVL